MTHLVTRESIVQALNNPNPLFVQAFVGRALVVLLDRQTRAEAASNTTQEHNMRGFASCDARQGSLTAKSWLKNKRLEDWQIAQWTRPAGRRGLPRLAKYWRQLDNEAQRKQAAKTAA